MNTTVHHLEPESIGQPAAAVSEKPDTRHWSDAMWANSKLPRGVANRLATIDRSLQGMRCINGLLRVSESATERARACDEHVPAYTLSASQTDGLHAALMVLQDAADSSIEELRDNYLDCVGVRA